MGEQRTRWQRWMPQPETLAWKIRWLPRRLSYRVARHLPDCAMAHELYRRDVLRPEYLLSHGEDWIAAEIHGDVLDEIMGDSWWGIATPDPAPAPEVPQ